MKKLENNRFPKLQKEITDFLIDEEGNIPRSKVIAIGSMMLVLSYIMTQEVHAQHYSHQSHRSHYSHRSHGSHGNSHSSHNSLPSPHNVKTPIADIDITVSENPVIAPVEMGEAPSFKHNPKVK